MTHQLEQEAEERRAGLLTRLRDEYETMKVEKAVAALDERDTELLAERVAALAVVTTPKVGDYVEFADGVTRRVSHVWEFDDGWSVQTSDSGSFHLGVGYVSFSGGLHPGVPAATLTDTGEMRAGACWFFHHDRHRGNNGIDVMALFRVWACSLEARS